VRGHQLALNVIENDGDSPQNPPQFCSNTETEITTIGRTPQGPSSGRSRVRVRFRLHVEHVIAGLLCLDRDVDYKLGITRKPFDRASGISSGIVDMSMKRKRKLLLPVLDEARRVMR